jgi:hypothetical protein
VGIFLYSYGRARREGGRERERRFFFDAKSFFSAVSEYRYELPVLAYQACGYSRVLTPGRLFSRARAHAVGESNVQSKLN